MANVCKSRCFLGVLVATVVGLCFAPALYSQVGTASLTGTVTDASGAVVPDAAIDLRSVNQSFTRSAKTGSDGAVRHSHPPTGQLSIDCHCARVYGAENAAVRLVIRTGRLFEHFAPDSGAIKQYNHPGIGAHSPDDIREFGRGDYFETGE